MAEIQFRADGDRLTLPAPPPERPRRLERFQAEAFSAGGARHLHDSGRGRTRVTLDLADLTDGEMADLLAFWDRRGGAREAFVWRDEDAEDRETHFAAQPLAPVRLAPDRWRVAVALDSEWKGQA